MTEEEARRQATVVLASISSSKAMRAAAQQVTAPPAPPPRLPSTGGSGDDGGMERRLSEVEKAVIRIDGRMDTIDLRLGRIESSVDSFKWWLLGAAVTILLASAATAIGIQQMTVATFQGAVEVARSSAPKVDTPPPPIIINVPAPPVPSPVPVVPRAPGAK